MDEFYRKEQEDRQKLIKAREDIENLRAQIENAKNDQKNQVLAQLTMTEEKPQLELKCRRTLKGHFGKIYALHWASDSTHIVSASQDGKLMIWNAITTNKKLAIPLRSAWVMTCAYAPIKREYVACGGLDNICSIFKINDDSVGWDTKQAYRELIKHEGYISECRFVQDHQILTSSGDATCILWDIENKRDIHVFRDHSGDVMSVDVHPNNQTFVSGSTDATAKIWDLRTDKPVMSSEEYRSDCVGSFTGHQSDINTVRYFPNAELGFASGSDDNTCRLYSLAAHRQINHYSDEETRGVTSIDFSDSGKYLFVGYDEEPKSCVVWDTLTAQPVTDLNHNARVSCIQKAPDGQSIATGCWDTFMYVYAK